MYQIVPLEDRYLAAFVAFRRLMSRESSYVNDTDLTKASELFSLYRTDPMLIGYLLVSNQGEVLGQLFMKVQPSTSEVILQLISVLAKVQGSGWGKRLLERAIVEGCYRGLKTLLLYVHVDNTPAIGFYESMGLRRRGTHGKKRWVYEYPLTEREGLRSAHQKWQLQRWI